MLAQDFASRMNATEVSLLLTLSLFTQPFLS